MERQCRVPFPLQISCLARTNDVFLTPRGDWFEVQAVSESYPHAHSVE